MYPVTNRLSERLSQAHYRIRTGGQLNAAPVQFVASKTKLIPVGLGILSTHIVVSEKDKASVSDEQDLFRKGFKLAKKINRTPLLRGMQFGYAILPLILGKDPDSELLSYASSHMKPRWALVEFPIVVDLTSNQVAFYRGTEFAGSAIRSILQGIIIQHIEPLLDP